MSALTKIILIMACLFLLLLPACTQAGTQAEPPQPATAAAVETLEALPPAPLLTATLPPATAAAGEQQASAGGDSGAVLEATEERPSADTPSPEPTEEPAAAPSATPQIVVTQTAEVPTPQATLTATAAAEAQDAEEEAPAPTETPIDEAVTGAVFGSSGTTADLVERGISLDVTGLAATYDWLVVPISEGVLNPLPRHILLTFDEDDPEEMMVGNGRRMVLFPVHPYLALYVTEGQSDVADQVARLRELIDTAHERTNGADLPPGDWMPLLPLVEDGRLLTWEQFAAVDFAGGRGVRFLSDYSGVPTYYYQGLSEEDRYYLSLIWPLAGEEIPELEQLDALVASFTIGERGE